jgi:catechol 2,3-dioxygenase-like lactoylglutathione lyase family enzyme
MKPQINIITLAVSDLEKSLKFYRDGLGLETKGIVGSEYEGSENQAAGTIVMFKLRNNLMLALYPRAELAKDAHQEEGSPNSTEFSVGYFAESKEEVDEVLRLAKEAGAILTDNAHKRPWGIYSGYFKDPDGHLWEIIWSPSNL